MEDFQVAGTKYKEITSGDEKRKQLSKKAKKKQLEKYCKDVRVKIGGINLYKRFICTGQDCLVHNSR